MRVNSIKVHNVLAIKSAEISFESPVVMVCGLNRAGKSSLGEAIKQAFTMQATRVDRKNEFGQLVHDGEKVGSVVIEHSLGETSLVLPKAEGQGQITHGALPFVLDSQLFAKLSATERREFLLKLMGVKMTAGVIIEKLKARGVDAVKADAVAPLLAAGIDSAQREAASEATKAKGEWKGITQENYGSKKAEDWKAEVPTLDESRLADMQKGLAEVNAEIEVGLKAIGEAGAPPVNTDQLKAQVAELREKAGKYARIQHKLNVDLEQETEWANKLAEAKQAATGKREGLEFQMAEALSWAHNNLPHGLDGIEIVENALAAYEDHHGPLDQKGDPELAAKLPEYQKAYDLICNSVRNGRRDLAEADAAAKTLDAIEQQLAQAGDSAAKAEHLAKLNTQLAELKAEKAEIEAAIRAEEANINRAKLAEERTNKAATAHANVKAWEAISDALKPEGIPSDLMAEALGPFNDLLAEFRSIGSWMDVHINADMQITSCGHEYRLCSESHQWRIDMLITCVIAAVSKLRFVMLDRMDLLDASSREQFLYFIDDLIADSELDGALVMATMKSKPKGLPNHIQVEWIEGGVVKSSASEILGQAA